MKSIPLFGTGIRAISDIVTRQRRVNCIYDIRKDQDRNSVVLLGTPGSTVWTQVGTGAAAPIRGWWVINQYMYVVAANALYRVTATGASTQVATGIAGTGPVGMEDNSLQMIIVTGGPGYVYTLATGTLTTITDVHFPTGATSVAFLNQRFIVNKPGTREFYVSALLDGLNWTYISLPIYGTKENSSDLLSEVDVLNGTLVLWGTESIEFWQDVGNTPLPYQRINGATQSWGLAARQSHAKIGNTEIFLGRSPDGGVRVTKLNGYVPTPISDADLDKIINSFTTVDDAVALVYVAYGHSVYQLTFPTENRTFAYDDNTGVWHEAQTGVAPGNARHFAQYGIAFQGSSYVTDPISNTIYLLDIEAYTDNGTNIKRQATTRHIRNQGNVLGLSELFLDFEVGVGITGLPPVPEVTPQAMLQISRDGGRTFGYERWVPLGPIGDYYTRAVLRRLGSARDFVVQITVTDAVKFVLTSGSAVVESQGE